MDHGYPSVVSSHTLAALRITQYQIAIEDAYLPQSKANVSTRYESMCSSALCRSQVGTGFR